jgi:ABC-type siderophore export system fused ATPase/permease subunit
VVAHDERIVSYADRVFHLEDGRLRQPEGRVVDASQADAVAGAGPAADCQGRSK